MRKLIKLIGLFMVFFGIGVYLYPAVSDVYTKHRTNESIEEFYQKYQIDKTGSDKSTSDSETESDAESDTEEDQSDRSEKFPELYKEIVKYNKSIYENGQENFKDAWSYEQTPINIDGLEDGVFGYIEIPAMDNLKMPLYIGASYENMDKGATVLGYTSIPIGGINTNSVIAGHRGWHKTSYFLYIENLTVGDKVYITNPWEKLTYRVESIDIIDPYNSDAVKIQEGKDMVTLVTCHPYMSHGKYRYVVYCVRDESRSSNDKTVVKPSERTSEAPIKASDGTVYESSNKAIREEKMIRTISAAMIILMVFFTILYSRRAKKG